MTATGAVTLYIGLFVLLFVILKINAGRVRGGSKVSVGHGGNDALQTAMRVQANAIEDVPIVLLGLIGLAAMAAPVNLIHGLGGSFFVFRSLHALGMGGAPGFGKGRFIGTLGSMLVMLATGVACLYHVFS